MKKIILTGLVTALTFLCAHHKAYAVSQKDMQILGRALGFIENGPSGDVKLGVVHGDSVTEADEIVSLIGNGLSSGKINIKAEKVSTGAAANANYNVLYFTEGTEPSQDSIFKAVNAKGIITVSTHDACLNTGSCVMVVKSVPKVDIRVSTAASQATGVSFGSAFRMMITEQ